MALDIAAPSFPQRTGIFANGCSTNSATETFLDVDLRQIVSSRVQAAVALLPISCALPAIEISAR